MKLLLTILICSLSLAVKAATINASSASRADVQTAIDAASADGFDIDIDQVTASTIVASRDYYTSAKPGFTPYTYPHPLVSGEVPEPEPEPSGAQVNIGTANIGTLILR